MMRPAASLRWAQRSAAFACAALGVAASALAAANPTPVFAARVTEKPIHDAVEALGTLRANETVSLAANVTEAIRAIHFDDGQKVEKGQVLAELTSAEESATLLEAQSMLDEAERQYERVKPLSESGAASGSLVDQRRREYETAKAQIEVIKSRLQDRLIVAPFSGVVGIRTISPGALVQPGQEIITLDDVTPMKLDFSVAAVYLQDISVGLPIEAVSDAFPGQTFAGKVTSIDSRINPATRSIRVRAEIPNPDGLLKPGLLMKVALQCRPRTALIIPEHAVISRGERQYVLKVDPTAAQPVPEQLEVKLGTRIPGEVEVLQGLARGDVVISHGGLRIQPGNPVTIKGYETPGKPLTQLLKETGQPADEG